eukprot:m51a1_g12079 hypothetical protein (294) ;mRNA; f:3278-4542
MRAPTVSGAVRLCAFALWISTLWVWFWSLVPLFWAYRLLRGDSARPSRCPLLDRPALLAHRAWTSGFTAGFLGTLGLRVDYEDRSGGERVDGGAIYVFNHVSNIDPVVVERYSRGARFMFKSELGALVPYAIPAVQLGHMSVRRHDKSSTTAAIDKAEWNLDMGHNIGIAPEGTRNRGDASKLLPFKRGAFVLSIKKHAPVIPMVCLHNEKLWHAGSAFPVAGHVVLRSLPPMRAEPDEEPEAFGERVRAAMQHELDNPTPFRPVSGLWDWASLHAPAVLVLASFASLVCWAL